MQKRIPNADFRPYREAVACIEGFSYNSVRRNAAKKSGDKIKDPGFFIERTRYFLDLIGNPEKNLKVIHVTGTAGKGTVSTMIQEVLHAAGKSVGLFTSPYVTTTIEKLRVGDGSGSATGNLYVDPGEFVSLVNYIKPYIKKAEKGPFGVPSAFELFVVLALLHFKRRKCEWAVLEVGLGGRYDATNIIDKPVVTAITNIDYDHTDILGKTLREIAYDKAGIIKKGGLFFTSEQRPTLRNFFKKTCTSAGAIWSEDAVIRHQKNYSDYNKELVRAIARSAPLNIPPGIIEKGISATRLPCRFEIVEEAGSRLGEPMIILDGAHNRAKIRSTIANLRRIYAERAERKIKSGKLFLLVAIADTKKDNQAILEPLLTLPHNTHIVFTRLRTEERRSVAPSLLLSIAKEKLAGGLRKNAKISGSVELEIMENPLLALNELQKQAKKDDIILVTGSFFLAGEIRKEWFSEEWVLKNRRSFKYLA